MAGITVCILEAPTIHTPWLQSGYLKKMERCLPENFWHSHACRIRCSTLAEQSNDYYNFFICLLQVAKASVFAFVDPITCEPKYLTAMFNGVSSRE